METEVKVYFLNIKVLHRVEEYLVNLKFLIGNNIWLCRRGDKASLLKASQRRRRHKRRIKHMEIFND